MSRCRCTSRATEIIRRIKIKKIIAVILILLMSVSCFAESDAAKYKDKPWWHMLGVAAYEETIIKDGLIQVDNRRLEIKPEESLEFFAALTELICNRYEREIGKSIDRKAVEFELNTHWILYYCCLFESHTKVTDIEVK